MNKDQLSKMNVSQLRKLAASVGVKYASKYRKINLIEKILEVGTGSVVFETTSNVCESDPTLADSIEKEPIEINMEQKMKYIENAPIGTLVAFRLFNGRVKSAKIVNRSAKSQKLKVETSYGRQFVISYTDVIWVRTTNKWPRGVYNQLKGIDIKENDNEES